MNDCKVIHSIAIRIKTKLLIRHIIYQFPLFIHIDIAAVHHTCAMGAVSSLGFYISHLNLSFPSPHPLPLHSFPVPVYKSLPSGNLSNSSRELSNYSYPLLKIIERLAMPSLGRWHLSWVLKDWRVRLLKNRRESQAGKMIFVNMKWRFEGQKGSQRRRQ